MKCHAHTKNEPCFSLDTLKSRETRKLIRHMGENTRECYEEIITDGARHECQMFIEGETRKGFYQAHWYPFGKDGPVVVCHYGLADETDQFTYISN